jgi:hypothetical protein
MICKTTFSLSVCIPVIKFCSRFPRRDLQSVGFSAAPVFAAAGIWFAVFGAALFLAGCCYCCCPSRSTSYSRAGLVISFALLLLFTAAAV